MARLALVQVIGLSFLSGACAALGPTANVSLVKSEVQATKQVDNIIIPDVTGIDATGNTGKAMLGTALKAYGTRSRPIAAANAVLSSVGAPDGVSALLTAAYQAEFIKQLKDAKQKPEQLTLPKFQAINVPNGLEGVKQMVPKLKAEASAIGEIVKALTSGDSANLATSLDKSKNTMALVQKLNEYLFDKLAVTYVLLTHVEGNEADWNAGKNVRYSAALMNIKTGKLRYFATVEAKKGAVPTPFMAQLGIMSGNLFSAVEEKDPLPEAPKAKETANLEISVTRY